MWWQRTVLDVVKRQTHGGVDFLFFVRLSFIISNCYRYNANFLYDYMLIIMRVYI